ncbi:hypothetical protein FIBSPDRAFT_140869 [Athelia psychrophila]|uniref:Uncharacterized protein n=1 Tax=Athelia psychrophila TaxID=1759441 RepID=A0A166BXN8_9AGAM|nr:hypothetical protein FIBSPDRAFT_140869 [Fibularhizoctonia sp. CBS 109695]
MSFRTGDLSRRAHSSSSSSSSTTIDDYTPRNSSSSDRTVSSTPSRRDSISSTISNISYLLPWIDTHSRPDLPDLGLRRRAHLRRQSAESDDSGRPHKHKYIRPLPPIPAEAWESLPSAEITRPTSVTRPLRRLPIPPLRPLPKAGKPTRLNHYHFATLKHCLQHPDILTLALSLRSRTSRRITLKTTALLTGTWWTKSSARWALWTAFLWTAINRCVVLCHYSPFVI